jgi:hypothetical protein
MRLWRRVKHVLYHRIAATGGFFVAEILGVMWPAIQKPKTLKDYRRKSLLAEMSIGVSQWRRSQRIMKQLCYQLTF